MNIGVHIYFQINFLFSLDIYLGVELVGYMVVIILPF